METASSSSEEPARRNHDPLLDAGLDDGGPGDNDGANETDAEVSAILRTANRQKSAMASTMIATAQSMSVLTRRQRKSATPSIMIATVPSMRALMRMGTAFRTSATTAPIPRIPIRPISTSTASVTTASVPPPARATRITHLASVSKFWQVLRLPWAAPIEILLTRSVHHGRRRSPISASLSVCRQPLCGGTVSP